MARFAASVQRATPQQVVSPSRDSSAASGFPNGREAAEKRGHSNGAAFAPALLATRLPVQGVP